jgi:DNA-directed RNA polymerase subunit M/transcription elongation factor TFIIS
VSAGRVQTFHDPSDDFGVNHLKLQYAIIQIELPKIQERSMAKVAKTADRKKVMDTSKSTDCPKCGKPTRIVKRMKDRERNLPGGIYISCSGCEFFEKL